MPKKILMWPLAFLMVLAGVGHFFSAENFIRIVPSYLPYPALLVSVSGFFEIVGGVGLLIPRLRKFAAWGLVALYVAVFPANVNMAIHNISFGEGPTPALLLWLRLPLQIVLIAWAYWYTKPLESNS
jgi:uncharacterized membrane protein